MSLSVRRHETSKTDGMCCREKREQGEGREKAYGSVVYDIFCVFFNNILWLLCLLSKQQRESFSTSLFLFPFFYRSLSLLLCL